VLVASLLVVVVSVVVVSVVVMLLRLSRFHDDPYCSTMLDPVWTVPSRIGAPRGTPARPDASESVLARYGGSGRGRSDLRAARGFYEQAHEQAERAERAAVAERSDAAGNSYGDGGGSTNWGSGG
jgi:hypothetical protein